MNDYILFDRDPYESQPIEAMFRGSFGILRAAQDAGDSLQPHGHLEIIYFTDDGFELVSKKPHWKRYPAKPRLTLGYMVNDWGVDDL